MTASRAEWQKPLDDLRAELRALADMPCGEERTARIAGIFSAAAGWGAEQKVFMIGQIDPRDAIEACRAGLVPWWEALAGATYFGRLEELRILRAAMEEDAGTSAVKPDLSTTMTWGAWNYSIAEGAPPALNPGVLNQLFDWGADPLYKDFSGASYFGKALRGSPSGIIHAFLAHGAPLPAATQVRDELIQGGHYKQAQEIQTALGLGGFYTKVDNQTLMETKYLSDAGRGCVLRTVFNFGAGRINEIFEIAGSAPAITSCNFDDYSRTALDIAREALEKLGGSPDRTIPVTGKPRRPGLGR